MRWLTEGTESVNLESGDDVVQALLRLTVLREGHTKQELVNALANCEHTADLVEANYNSNSLLLCEDEGD